MYRIRNEMERMLEHGLVIPVEKKSLSKKNKADKPNPFKLYFKYGSKILAKILHLICFIFFIFDC